jgi:spore coat protein U-like protein
LRGPAFAQQTSCNGGNVSLSLGAYNAFQAAPLDSSGISHVELHRTGRTGTTTVRLGIGPSTVSGTIATRQMALADGHRLLSYNLYRDAGRTLVWGEHARHEHDGSEHHASQQHVGSAHLHDLRRINALQDVRPGTYNDSLTVTATF